MNDAFSQPFQLDQMIRITFVVGAGKLGRSKYDAKTGMHVTSALKELGFVEDRGASCVNECAGSYKSQHDTGKNLFTVVVFPKLAAAAEPQDAQNGGETSYEYPIPIPLVEGTPVHTILLASEDTFQKMASTSMCPTWDEKKMCSEVLKLGMETLQSIDNKLMTGTALSEQENAFYDETGGVLAITAKAEYLKKLMASQVEDGKLMQHELDRLLQQVEEKIDAFNADIDEATQRSQEKKVAKLTAQKEKAVARKKMLKGHTAQSPKQLKHEAQIMTLSKQLQPLLKLESTAKGRLLSMKETKQLAAKDEMMEEISQLEEASQGWFEDEDAFHIRLEASRKKRAAASKTAKTTSGGKGKKPGTGSRSMATSAWLTPGSSGVGAKQAAAGKKATATKKSKPKSGGGGGVFAAMMMDSDSDSD